MRHAHAERYGPATLDADPGLTTLGRRQAILTRDFLAVADSIDACYHAPTRRAEETAALVADPHGLEPRLCWKACAPSPRLP